MAHPDDLAEMVEEAYVFAFPMMMGYRAAFAAFLVPSIPSYRGPLNEVHSKAVTLDHRFRDVITPNADTPYSMGGLDLRAEPLVLDLPAVTDRYYVIQFVDLYGTNPHFLGSRATGSEAGSYLLVGPRYEGEVPDGFDGVLRFETDLVILIGRTQVFGPDDIAAVGPIMDDYRLTPLSRHQGREPVDAESFDWPIWDDAASRDERFIGYLNALLALCQPPHPSELEMIERWSAAGIGPGVPFDADALDDETRTALRTGVDRARAKIERRVTTMGTPVNGWSSVDALGSREMFDGDYLLRAAGAMAGWGGNDKVEAMYPLTRRDGAGEPLSGDHRYRIRLTTPPPAKAFWSVTIYDTSYDGVSGYLVDNEIDRYNIGSTTEGLVYGDDGSLVIHIQRDRPDTAEGEANWLPAPEGPLYLAMRIYWPKPEALDGTWEPPPVERI